MILRERTIGRSISTTVGKKHVGRLDELAFDSIGELLGHSFKERPSGGFDWIGVASERQLRPLVDDGWSEMEQKMNSMLEEISPPPAELRPELNRRRRRKRADHGNSVDIHQIWQGKLDRAWEKTYIEQVETVGNKLVHICVNLSAAAGIDFHCGLWRGAAVMRVYDVLSRMGKSVAISGYYASHGTLKNGRHAMASVRIKGYGEPLRTDRLAACMTLGFGRTYLMTLGIDQHPTLGPSWGRGYPVDDYALLTHAAEMDQQHGGAVVAIGQCFDRTQAQKIVDKFMRQYVNQENVEGLSSFELLKNMTANEEPNYVD